MLLTGKGGFSLFIGSFFVLCIFLNHRLISFTVGNCTCKDEFSKVYWRRSGVFIVTFEHISCVSIVNFEKVNAGCAELRLP